MTPKHTQPRHTFTKAERCRSKKVIDALFTTGASFYLYPFSIRSLQATDSANCHQMMVSVSKHNFKLAVDRNRVKRLVREAYRLQKSCLTAQHGYLIIAYIYVAKEIHSYAFIAKKIQISFRRLQSQPPLQD